MIETANQPPGKQGALRSAIPRATYRLQLHKDFTLEDACNLVGYWSELGISHLYLSPIQTARAGSLHGYDVVDHRRINPELGGEAALRQLAEACARVDMGLIVDIVPNHMAVGGSDNPMWLDVLEQGAASPFARVFDIDFEFGDGSAAGKIIVPVLGEPYGDALRDGKLSLIWDPALVKLAFAYGPHRFPLRPEDYAQVTGGAEPSAADLSAWRDPETLHQLLEKQHFRLTWWNAAGDIINWRRFFDVNELAGLRMEDEAVFRLTHDIILRLYADGVIDGVRVDHVDGLADPAEYLQRLRQYLRALNSQRPRSAPQDGPYIVVEKILGSGESMAKEWGVQGTTGYDFMDQVNALLHHAEGESALNAAWAEIAGKPDNFETEETAARVEVLQGGFAGQLAACSTLFAELAHAEIDYRDLTAESFRRGLVAFIAHLRRYRSYVTGTDAGVALDPAVEQAFDAASETVPADAASLAFVVAILRGTVEADPGLRQSAIRRLNQLTAPVAAKAVEDTAFYRYSRLLSRNDVGFNAGRLAITVDEFLQSGQGRVVDWPHAMLATATHDHKRGEDVRARLAVLSEVPELWRKAVTSWFDITASARPDDIAPEDAYSLFQTLVGAWPLDLEADSPAPRREAFAGRVVQWREKSLREAKLRSSWAAPNLDYEAAHRGWIETLLDPARSLTFLQSLTAFVTRIAGAGAINGVVQAGLRCLWPGVPDLYQGAELWDFSLVDPDNRRPVDYDLRRTILAEQRHDWASGAVKEILIARLLEWRRSDPELFTSGTLHSAQVHGPRSAHVLAFTRGSKGSAANIAVVLHVGREGLALGQLPDAGWWAGTSVEFATGPVDAHTLFRQGPVYAEPETVLRHPDTSRYQAETINP